MEPKVIVITGASAGIGAALAERLSEGGHHLVLAARRATELRAVAARCHSAVAVPTDVCKREQVEALRDAALATFGHIDVWINNAGQGIAKSVQVLTDEDFDAVMAINVKSALYGMQAITPHFQARGTGHIINVSSFLGKVPLVPYRSAYNAAKAALNALTANLRMELAVSHPGVAVSVVLPGVVTTEFARNALGSAPVGGAAPAAAFSQTATEVAERIVGLIAAPTAELYTNEGQAAMAAKYVQDVGAFEANLRQQGRPR